MNTNEITKVLHEKVDDSHVTASELRDIAYAALSAVFCIEDDLDCEIVLADNGMVDPSAIKNAIQKNMYLLEEVL